MQAMYTDSEIQMLIDGDSKMIILALNISEDLGKAAIQSVLSNINDLFARVKGRYIPFMDLDYRRYIVGLVDTTTKSANEKHKELIFSQIVLPKGLSSEN